MGDKAREINPSVLILFLLTEGIHEIQMRVVKGPGEGLCALGLRICRSHVVGLGVCTWEVVAGELWELNEMDRPCGSTALGDVEREGEGARWIAPSEGKVLR